MPLLCFPSLSTQLPSFPMQFLFLRQHTFLLLSQPPRSTEFLPLEHSLVKGIEEKVFSEQQLLEGYTHKQAQDCYIHASCSLPTYGSVFFPCKVCPSLCVISQCPVAPPADWLFDWLIDQFIDWLINWSIYWLIDLLIDWWQDWLMAGLIDWLLDWSIYWLIDWLIDHLLTDWLIDGRIDWFIDWLIDPFIDWVIEWLIDWLIDWSVELMVCWLVVDWSVNRSISGKSVS